jgi:hypothetical protein
MANLLKATIYAVALVLGGITTFAWFDPRNVWPARSNKEIGTIARQAPPKKMHAPVLTSCLSAELAKGASIFALGSYGAQTDASAEVNSDNHKIGQIDLYAAESGPPLILIVSAYDPVIWDVSGVPPNRIRAVLATGYYDQMVTGLPKSVPVRTNSYSTPDARCGRFSHAYKGGIELDELVRTVQLIFGRNPDGFQGSYRPMSFTIDGNSLQATK